MRLSIERAALLKALGHVQNVVDFAISTEETRYYLNGIYVHAHDGALRAVATDGHRLALAEMDLPAGADGLPGVIIPRKTVAEIRRLIDGGEADIAISVEKSRSIKIALTQDNLALTVNNPESGNAHEELMVDYSADPLEIGFNAKYLLDVAGHSPASPALVKDAEDPGALFVLMPLRV